MSVVKDAVPDSLRVPLRLTNFHGQAVAPVMSAGPQIFFH